MIQTLATAVRGKGLSRFAQRAGRIVRGYGPGPQAMEDALRRFAAVLEDADCQATFPTVAAVLRRNPRAIQECQARGIEIAVHGYRHSDFCQLSQEEQSDQLALAKRTFAQMGIAACGFRGPYLHANRATAWALNRHGFAYDSSQALSWDVLDQQETPAFRRALAFYGALSAREYPSLPSLDGGLVSIPYSLPDDEALVDRLSLAPTGELARSWLAILRRSHDLGELFTLGLHPERITACEDALVALLSEARRLSPAVWIARLGEIAAWWRARSAARVEVQDEGAGRLRVTMTGPPGACLLVRGAEVDGPTVGWAGGYRRALGDRLAVRAAGRPWIGVSPETSPALVDFLGQQGYIVELGEHGDRHAHYFDQPEFPAEQQRPLLAEIEDSESPLVRLGRWPDGARSAFAVTGDIDALTLWDYGWRLLGR